MSAGDPLLSDQSYDLVDSSGSKYGSVDRDDELWGDLDVTKGGSTETFVWTDPPGKYVNSAGDSYEFFLFPTKTWTFTPASGTPARGGGSESPAVIEPDPLD